jgi:hypothetical protein
MKRNGNKTSLDRDTNNFIEGVVKRCNEIYKKTGLAIIDLDDIVENINKKKNKKIKRKKVVDIIHLKEDGDIAEEDDDIKIITQQEYEENLKNTHFDADKFNCVICFKNKLKINTRVYPCGHEFCDKCSFKWVKLNNTCPICRTPIYNW